MNAQVAIAAIVLASFVVFVVYVSIKGNPKPPDDPEDLYL